MKKKQDCTSKDDSNSKSIPSTACDMQNSKSIPSTSVDSSKNNFSLEDSDSDPENGGVGNFKDNLDNWYFDN